MKKIKLTQNQEAIVDDDLYEELNKTKWQSSYHHNYNRPRGWVKNIKSYKVMHRYIYELKYAKKGQDTKS